MTFGWNKETDSLTNAAIRTPKKHSKLLSSSPDSAVSAGDTCSQTHPRCPHRRVQSHVAHSSSQPVVTNVRHLYDDRGPCPHYTKGIALINVFPQNLYLHS